MSVGFPSVVVIGSSCSARRKSMGVISQLFALTIRGGQPALLHHTRWPQLYDVYNDPSGSVSTNDKDDVQRGKLLQLGVALFVRGRDTHARTHARTHAHT